MSDREPGDIAAVLRSFGLDNVPDAGAWRGCRCPFHDDRRASARVNTALDAFVCLGCGIKGDSLKLIMEVEHVDFNRALTRYEEIVGREAPGVSKAVRRTSGRFDISGEPRTYERGSGFLPGGFRSGTAGW